MDQGLQLFGTNLRLDGEASQRRTKTRSYKGIVEGQASHILISENPDQSESRNGIIYDPCG